MNGSAVRLSPLVALIAAFYINIAGLTHSAIAQGTIDFRNLAIMGGVRVVDAPVRNADGTLLLGTIFRAALYGGAAGTAESELRMFGPSAGFLTIAAGAGYFAGGTRTLNENGVTVTPGAPATLQVRVWDLESGPTWESAVIRGQSSLLTINTGGAGIPPSTPALLIGLNPFTIPEPSTTALGITAGLGALLMLPRRRR